LDKCPVDIAEVAESIIEAARPSFVFAGVELVARLEPAVGIADPHRLGQVASNLLANALKFTDRGGTVTVTVRPEGDNVFLAVADTGTGIPAEALDHIFDRFWQGRQVGRVAGSGIGLAVVQTLVEAHSGVVTVASSPGQGSTFTIVLPGSTAQPVEHTDTSKLGEPERQALLQD
jgi:signal transduction histidine kinase